MCDLLEMMSNAMFRPLTNVGVDALATTPFDLTVSTCAYMECVYVRVDQIPPCNDVWSWLWLRGQRTVTSPLLTPT